jgi:hypothetical protein
VKKHEIKKLIVTSQSSFGVKGQRNPKKIPARVNSVRARLSIQRKADAVVIDKAKSINRNKREVKIWGKSVTGRLAHED